MNEIALRGCAQKSLAGYLKGLGVFRLVAEQLDHEARACWKSGHLVLLAAVTPDDLKTFFLSTYKPTPLISPWSGRAGFLEGEAGEDSTRKGASTLRLLAESIGVRFESYRRLVEAARRVSVIDLMDRARPEIKKLEKLNKAKRLDEAGRTALRDAQRELEALKAKLVLSLRAELDDSFLPWIDACFALVEGKPKPAPLLGSGGNEGSMDFSTNHLASLLDLIDPDSDKPASHSAPLLSNALFDQTEVLSSATNIGFLNAVAAGGVNMSAGFSATAGDNPWTSVLVMEGAVLFGASVTRRLESSEHAQLAFPFTVHATLAGDGSIAGGESAKHELWLPTWHQPAPVSEVRRLFAEGRCTQGGRPAANGLDMLQSLAGLGIDRGVTSFERVGFFERRGKQYYVATHLGSYEAPRERIDSFIAADLQKANWLRSFSHFAGAKNTAKRFVALRRQLEDCLFGLSGRDPNPAEVQELLIVVGDIQHSLSRSAKAREAVAPIPRLSERWVVAADDGSPEFRIAKALAGLRGVGDVVLPLRAQIFPVQRTADRWMTPEAGESVRIHVDQGGRLTDTLTSLLGRRLWLMERLAMHDKPLASPAGALLDDVAAFLIDPRMDARIQAMLPGLCLCDIAQDTERSAGDGRLPAAFGLMKLALATDRDLRGLGYLPAGERLPVPAGMVATLAAGNPGNRAVTFAWRRLRASGMTPGLRSALPMLGGVEGARACAALLIPLRWAATAALARSLLDQSDAPKNPADNADLPT